MDTSHATLILAAINTLAVPLLLGAHRYFRRIERRLRRVERELKLDELPTY